MTKAPLPGPLTLFYRPVFFCRFVTEPKTKQPCKASDHKNEGKPEHGNPLPSDNSSDSAKLTDGQPGGRPGHPAQGHKNVFRAFPNRGTGPNLQPQIKLWTRHPAEIGYDEEGAFTINLFQTPEMYLQGAITQIAADDHTHNNGYTTIGPEFPHAYGAGGIYVCREVLDDAIERDKCACLNHNIPTDAYPLSLIDDLVIVAFKPNPVEDRDRLFVPVRYHGFYGKKLSTSTTGGAVWVVWHPGTWKSKELEPAQPATPCYQHNQQWRPPRKLWIPDAVLPTAAETPRDVHAAQKSLDECDGVTSVFLEQSYALYTAELAVPKQPSGSSEDGSVASTADVSGLVDPAPPMPNQGRERSNLNVISAYGPGEISRIKRVLIKAGTPFLTVEEGQTLVSALSAYVGRLRSDQLCCTDPQPPFDNLDLIGHSRTNDHVLKLGELTLTSGVARAQFTELRDRGVLDVLEIKAIRLLGCRTASHPRGEQVVRAIVEATELTVYATRGDLFAVHYGRNGLRPEAELLLADDDVILKSGAGDMPPSDDYLPSPPDDDPDDPQDDDAPARPVQPPDRFSLAALSDPNASRMAAHNYYWWNWQPHQLAALVESVYADCCQEDNPLLRADWEVLLSTSPSVDDISDIRSLDLFLHGARPRIRVNRGGKSFAFYFRHSGKILIDHLRSAKIATLPPAPSRPHGAPHAQRE